MYKKLLPLFFRAFSFLGFSRHDRTKYVRSSFILRDTTTGYPYISGDAFRAFSDHVVDATGLPFFSKRVKEGDTVFVKTKYLRRFIKYMHPSIKNRYILITHAGDEEIPGEYGDLLKENKIIKWYGINATVLHPKITPLPIGFGNAGKNAIVENMIAELHRNPLPKLKLLYLNFNTATHPERSAIKSYFASQPFCTIEDSIPLTEYFRSTMHAKFTISPRGNGIDCH